MWLHWGWLAAAWADLSLESADCVVTVHGGTAEIHLRQVFLNTGEEAVAATYMLPLPDGAYADAVQIKVAEATFETEVLSHKEASERYKSAHNSGRPVAVETIQVPGSLSQHLKNLPPGEEIVIESRIIEPVAYKYGAYELSLRWPRFYVNHREVPFGVDQTASIDVTIDSGLPEAIFDSAGLPFRSPSPGRLEMKGRAPLATESLLRWSVDSEQPSASIHIQDDLALITLTPPSRGPLVPIEMIFVVDQSPSMDIHLDLVRSAASRILGQLDERDKLRVIGSLDRFENPHSQRATPENIGAAMEQIEQIETHLIHNPLAALYTALRARRSPDHERQIVFLTDGAFYDKPYLDPLVERLGENKLAVFQVDYGTTNLGYRLQRSPNVSVTRQSAYQSEEELLQEFMRTVRRPIAVDLEIDFGDWIVSELPRVPELLPGQPVTLTAKIIERGSSNIVVSGRTGGGPYRQVIAPAEAGEGRFAAVRHALSSDDPERRSRYGVVSYETAQVFVERNLEQTPLIEPRYYSPRSGGGCWFPSVEDIGTERAELLRSAAVGRIVHPGRAEEPASMLWQSIFDAAGLISTSPLVGLSGGERYSIDGANITDPVTGAPAFHLDSSVVERLDLRAAGHAPSVGGATGPAIEAISQTGSDYFSLATRVEHLSRIQGAPLSAQQMSGRLSGPIVRDRLWGLLSYGLDRSMLRGEGERGFLGHQGFANVTFEPSSAHRLSVSGAAETASVRLAGASYRQESLLGLGRWRWFIGPGLSFEASASAQEQHIADDRRQRLQASAVSRAEIRDPLRGEHQVEVGAAVERASWGISEIWAEPVLDVPAESEASVEQGSLFLQDRYAPSRALTLEGGARAEIALGQTYIGPRAYATLAPPAKHETRLLAGYGRRYGAAWLPVVAAGGVLPRLDEGLIALEREILSGHSLGAEGTLQRRTDSPTYGGTLSEQLSISNRLYLRSSSERWGALWSWRYTRLVSSLQAGLSPSSQRFEGSMYAKPWLIGGAPGTIGVALDSAFASGQWRGGIEVGQDLYTAAGLFRFDLRLLYLDLSDTRWLPDDRIQPALLGTPSASGPRLQLGLTWEG